METDNKTSRPLSTAYYINLAEEKLDSCIQVVFGKPMQFIVTGVLLDDTDDSLKVEFVIPMLSDRKRFVWFFNRLSLLKQAKA